MAELRLVLASASPRRNELLRLAGLDPVVAPADVDEQLFEGEDPVAHVVRLARTKACAIATEPGDVVVGADTVVVVDGVVLGKPRDADEAVAMLRRLAGRPHTVATGVAVAHDGAVAETVVSTEVVMAPLSDPAITAYVETGEPLDKAGAYAIQGRAAAFVERINGSWTNVVGLPVVETLELLRGAGIDLP